MNKKVTNNTVLQKLVIEWSHIIFMREVNHKSKEKIWIKSFILDNEQLISLIIGKVFRNVQFFHQSVFNTILDKAVDLEHQA